jgi:hypothetical protein
MVFPAPLASVTNSQGCWMGESLCIKFVCGIKPFFEPIVFA